MIAWRALAWELPCLLLLTACGGADTPEDDTATVKLPRAKVAAERPREAPRSEELPGTELAAEGLPESMGSAQPHTLGSSHYTSLEPASCKLLEENAEEGGYWRRRCAGSAGYALETSESDLRQDIVIIAADGRRSKLNLSTLVARGAFNSLGKTAEWRGLAPGQPRALIVRLGVAADPEARRPDISNLVVVRLDGPICVVAVVPRGPGQNEKARAIADGKQRPCVKSKLPSAG
jgi:hypothetical protein